MDLVCLATIFGLLSVDFRVIVACKFVLGVAAGFNTILEILIMQEIFPSFLLHKAALVIAVMRILGKSVHFGIWHLIASSSKKHEFKSLLLMPSLLASLARLAYFGLISKRESVQYHLFNNDMKSARHEASLSYRDEVTA